MIRIFLQCCFLFWEQWLDFSATLNSSYWRMEMQWGCTLLNYKLSHSIDLILVGCLHKMSVQILIITASSAFPPQKGISWPPQCMHITLQHGSWLTQSYLPSPILPILNTYSLHKEWHFHCHHTPSIMSLHRWDNSRQCFIIFLIHWKVLCMVWTCVKFSDPYIYQ